jgi:hypothetical protein
MNKKRIKPLAIADFDIEELERRLELAAPAVQAQEWFPGESCQDCPTLGMGGGGCGCN